MSKKLFFKNIHAIIVKIGARNITPRSQRDKTQIKLITANAIGDQSPGPAN